MTHKEFIDAYQRAHDWLVRIYKDDKVDVFVEAFQIMGVFQDTIAIKYLKDDKIKLSYKRFERLVGKFIGECRKRDNHIAAEAIFKIFNDLKTTYKEDRQFVLNDYLDFLSKPTDKELEYAYSKLSLKEDVVRFSGGEIEKEKIRMLDYKGLRMIEYYGDAYLPIDDEAYLSFNLVWDWWYPIDRYIYLGKGWKMSDDFLYNVV